MASIVAGSTAAAITAMIMTFEMTQNYAAMLPMMLSISLAYLIRRMLCPESIYTLKLKRRGLPLPQGLRASGPQPLMN